MMPIDLYSGVGYALELLARSENHRNFSLKRYLEVEILPPLRLGQARFYLTPDGIPTGFASWAFLDEDTERTVLETGRALGVHEWRCGDRLFFNDFLAPYGTAREIIFDLRKNIFPGRRATSVRRHASGALRSVKHWKSRAQVEYPSQEAVDQP
ncbi:toxin-activating lysine-acyltransferase [Nitratireductor kimnyeongensis]|uniref:RTX toxin-activating lysine-acyltransferase n=1 Tax=Nitratireductor kimnyeongensis TaxID=430679 RepID=A0ABW0T9J1_9HYPH|nr:toxin-activating lysine-acyltransferase [Nitratireductor kimnyeongensis]QZZ35518.1 toxin-activating lysine-acyltransferase [Nitratireductor kimnyeongensis]